MNRRVKKFLNNKITIFRKSGTSDKYGGVDNEWAKIYWAILCRIYKASGTSKLSYEGRLYSIISKLICERDVDVQIGDKVVDNNYDNSYIIVGVYKIQGTKKVHHIEALLAREQ